MRLGVTYDERTHPSPRHPCSKPQQRNKPMLTQVFAKIQSATPTWMMPPAVRLVGWNLKQPPVALETCSVVTDCVLFARTTVEQLRTALDQPKRWVGWSVAQLIDRLAQVGVIVAVEPGCERGGPNAPG